jgi:AraC family transcriptional regulator of adaptative response/methylated-DNA-[protein]-cysteine methyltransferase
MMMTLPKPSEMFRAVLERDTSYEGVFVVAVKTTGIFCRPSCPAKKPRRENVEFFGSASAALHAGYRACKRCKPMDSCIGGNGEASPAWVQQLLARVDRKPEKRITERDLRAMRIEPARARRYFARHFGMTFHAYHRARRLGLALSEVRSGHDATNAGYRSGFNSTSGFRDAFAKAFGAPPGKVSEIAHMTARWLDTPLGAMLAIADDEGLRLLEFVDRRGLPRELEVMRARLRCAITPGRNETLDRLANELKRYFAGTLTKFTTPIAPFGSTFQLRVWKRLRAIPYAETRSYAQVAKETGRAGSQRAIGTANGMNRIAILIPCHRVVRSDGSLSGYGGGMWRKKWLLEHERDTRCATALEQ